MKMGARAELILAINQSGRVFGMVIVPDISKIDFKGRRFNHVNTLYAAGRECICTLRYRTSTPAA